MAASLAGFAVVLGACAAGSPTQHNSSQISRPGSTATLTSGVADAAAAVTAVAPAALTGPGAGSWGDGRLDLFYRSSRDGQLAHQWYLPGPLATWTAAQSLGGVLTSQPAVASWAAGRYDVFARGADNAVWHKWFSSGKWSGWQSLGGVASSSPAAAAWSTGRLDLFVRGTNNQLYTRHYTTLAGWSGWSSLGGVLTSGPAVASWGPGRLDVFARGADNAVWHKWFSSGKWSGWQSLGGRITGEPAAASTGTSKLDLFARGTDNTLFTRNYNVSRAGWSAWASLGGTLTSSPGATVPAVAATAVFVRGANGGYYYRQRSATQVWSGWQLADAALTFRGLGAWVDTYDYSALNPATVVADLKAHGVRTLYLGTARYDSAADILYPADVAAWLAAAHAAGLRVVGWYVPDYADLTRDVRRTLAIATYVSLAGQRFDAIGIDIEYMPAGTSPNVWNQAVATQLARVRAGTALPVVAIVLPPVLMRLYPDRWSTFPWPALAADANAVAPMSYWTSYTPAPLCAAGDQRYCAYQYTRDNVLLSRQYTGLPVHVIGGSGDAATLAQVADYVRAARETAAAGGSFYDYRTTKPAFWPYLEQLKP
ncbi:MAG TPA: hypothetical protein VFO01_01210 [Trebonia sp.]|nr:hypothetical protein [Trebonia sp.]